MFLEKCPNQDTTCKNGGYLGPLKEGQEKCFCDCPPETTGEFCETYSSSDYYEAIEPLQCGGNITEEGYIETPDYPMRNKTKQSCVWVIKVWNQLINFN